jgi:hypothetical protein
VLVGLTVLGGSQVLLHRQLLLPTQTLP